MKKTKKDKPISLPLDNDDFLRKCRENVNLFEMVNIIDSINEKDNDE